MEPPAGRLSLRAFCLLSLLACGAFATRTSIPQSDRHSGSAGTGAGCWRQWGRKQRTLLVVADPGEFASLPEAFHYLNNLKNGFKLPEGESGCPEIYLGDIMGQRVAVVMTGIGQEAAAMCVFEVLLRCGARVKDAVSSGTSGWSPQLGGILNNGTCEGGAANDNGRITRIGDICVSPFAVNWNCHKASWTMTAKGYPNLCTYPELLFSPRSSELFGKCQFAGPAAAGSVPLAEELAAAARAGLAGVMPPRPGKIQSDETLYWSYMAAGTQAPYPTLSASAAPTVWNHKECMEVSSQYFWSGPPWDMVARSYVADTLNAAGLGRAFAQTEVFAVSAMEGVGVAAAFDRYAGMKGGRVIQYTIVRGMSNWAVQPVKLAPSAAASEPANATASDAPKTEAGGAGGGAVWVEGTSVPEDFQTGYAYAIASSSAATLAMLRTRCQKLPRPPSGACAFEIKA